MGYSPVNMSGIGRKASIGDLVFAYSGHATYFAVDDTNLVDKNPQETIQVVLKY